ncbi:unnamed protein product [Soboliphyme baturini]|uniref:Deacetylase sirtuin-type domain-containing protein n=1 Tax=Soboliphyme baturini TaxID=241478 RepID=A0A183J8P9_9BILA|nr:unnamed protein product [Soboliphyme baturini]
MLNLNVRELRKLGNKERQFPLVERQGSKRKQQELKQTLTARLTDIVKKDDSAIGDRPTGGQDPNGRPNNRTIGDCHLAKSRLCDSLPVIEIQTRRQLRRSLNAATVNAVKNFIQLASAQKIIVMCGAGISTAAGIPDFRSPGTGIYSKLQEAGLTCPEEVFEIQHFTRHPETFYEVLRSIWRSDVHPTVAHFFMRLLHDKGLLLRVYTQNIDGLERAAGIPVHKIVQAHGTLDSCHCQHCQAVHPIHYLKSQAAKVAVPRCVVCKGTLRPDIVFYNEDLPSRFFDLLDRDFQECDLLIVMGTSLTVTPFNQLIDKVRSDVPRLLINGKVVGVVSTDKMAVVTFQSYFCSSLLCFIRHEIFCTRKLSGAFWLL